MKKFRFFSVAVISAIFMLILQSCSFSTANMSSLKTAKDKDGKSESTNFTTGDTLNALATISNNPGKVKVKFSLMAEDVKGMTKGETLKGSDITVEIPGDGVAKFNAPVAEGFPAGKYKLNADMLNENGEKKDGKSVDVTITQTAPAVPKADDKSDADDKSEPEGKEKDH